MEHPDHSGGALVRRLIEPHQPGQVGIGGGAGDGGGPGVGDLRDHGAQRDDHGGVDRLGDASDGLAEGAPHQVGLDALDEHEVAAVVGPLQHVDAVVGPVDHPPTVGTDPHEGPSLGEVEERIGVDLADLDGIGVAKRLDRAGCRATDVEESFERGDEQRGS